jgi:hypothetical protein
LGINIDMKYVYNIVTLDCKHNGLEMYYVVLWNEIKILLVAGTIFNVHDMWYIMINTIMWNNGFCISD